MIVILDQQKEGIFKCKNVYTIGKDVRTSISDDDYTTIGTYSTDERAKEVVTEIWERIGQGLCIQRYEMPKE